MITPWYVQLFWGHYLENNIKETLFMEHYSGAKKRVNIYLRNIIKGGIIE